MERAEYKYDSEHCDKSKWARGEWDSEPDKVQFEDRETGLPCLIVRTLHSGHLCGYVGVAEGHPLFGKSYSERIACDRDNLTLGKKSPMVVLTEAFADDDSSARVDSVLDVHGGITFTAFCDEAHGEGRGICHIPAPGEPDRVWWFGFDCAHYNDLSPSRDCFGGGEYRNVAYVASECASLAKQLKAMQ